MGKKKQRKEEIKCKEITGQERVRRKISASISNIIITCLLQSNYTAMFFYLGVVMVNREVAHNPCVRVVLIAGHDFTHG